MTILTKILLTITLIIGAFLFALGWIVVMFIFFKTMLEVIIAGLLLWAGYQLINVSMETFDVVKSKERRT